MASSSTTSIGGNMENSLRASNKDDAFRFLHTLFSVAASRWPQDLRSRRPLIMEKLYAPPPEKKKEEVPPPPPPVKKKPRMIIRLKIPPALRASQATATPDDDDDHRHHKAAAAAAERDYSSVAPINKNANETAHADRKNSKKIVRAGDDEENGRLEASINKLNSQCRAAQINKRKIQVVEFQAQNKKKKKNNFITKLRQEAKKTKIAPTKQLIRRPPPQTLTSWIDAQTRRTQGFSNW